nr:MAG: RNA-dependent RNA polymerase [Astroviridae sp.]
MFEKFHYSEACDIENTFPDVWDFATRLCLDEYSYMQGSVITPIYATSKNVDSTPAFPKFLEFETEGDYISTCGWQEYIDLWNNPERRRPLWWTFLKNETLKVKKIEENDIRMIMCTDPCFTRFGAAFEEHQNNLMKQYTETHQAQVGWTPFYGGLNHRVNRLSENRDVYVEMDWTRFDGTIPVEVFRHIKNMRFFFLSETCKTPENKARYEWYVDNIIHKLVLLPTGEITYINKGNPSGQISTTTDNNMVNTFLTAFEIAYLYKLQHGSVPTLQQYRDNVDSICYGDDRLLAINSAFLTYDVKILPEMYKTIFGMWVKSENVKISRTMNGLSFCGMTLLKTPSTWVGTPNVNKILSTLENPVKRLPDVQSLWGKLVSLRILCEYSTEEVKDYLDLQIQKVAEYCRVENIALPEVPSYFYTRIWTGGPK